MLGTAITFVTYVLFRRLRKPPIKLVMCLCVCIFASFLMFLVNTLTASSASKGGCFVLGLLLHYWLLAWFCCTFTQGLNMYQMFVKLDTNQGASF